MSDVLDRLTAALADRYRIERELGVGGMATVYLADDVKHGRKVAIKVLKPELAAVIGGDRFVAEIRTTASLQHPHILPLFDSGEADGFLYYVMPYVEGESLRDRLDREKQLSVNEAVSIAKSVASALQYAHERDVIHRDIKPENILLHAGQPVVADFGIALAISAAGGGRMTETGLSLGTPHYMSPEQATADRDLSARSDVYSLACVLYEMLAGDPPHTGPTAQAILVRILTETPRPVSDTRTSVPGNVAAVLAKALEKLPADRFESAAEFGAALDQPGFSYAPARRTRVPGESAPAAETAGARSAAATSPLLRFAPWGVAGVALLVALAAWLGGGSAGGGVSDDPPVRSIIDLGGIQLGSSSLARVVVSPDGSRFAVGSGFGSDSPGIYVRSAEDMEFRLVPGTENEGVSDIAFSPESDWIAYADRDRLMKVSVFGGQPVPVIPSGGFGPRMLDWGPGGWIVFWAASADGTGLFRVPETGGTPERLVGAPEWPATTRPQLLPDGSGVLFSDFQDRKVALYDFGTDSVTVVVPNGIEGRYLESGYLVYLDEAGTLWGAPFDLGRHRVAGDAKPVLQGVATDARFGRVTVSRNGTLVYQTGGSLRTFDARQGELVVVGLDGSVTPLDLSPRNVRSPVWAPDGRRIAYAGTGGGRSGGATPDEYHIFVYDVVLENAPRALTNEGNNFQPIWSPDGHRVVFSSAREGTEDGDLFIRNVDDDLPPRHLLKLPGTQTVNAWPEDDLLVVESGSPSGIYLVHLEGDSATVAPYYTPDADVDDPATSPDGKWAAYVSDESGTGPEADQVYLRRFPELRAETRVSEDGGAWPFWSPDGRTLYYLCQDDHALCAADVTTEPTAIVTRRRVVMEWPYDFAPSLHPDGDRLIAVRSAAASEDADDETAVQPERQILVHNWFAELRRFFETENR